MYLPGVVAHSSNPRTQETKAETISELQATWSTEKKDTEKPCLEKKK